MEIYTLEQRENAVIIRLEPARIDVKSTRQLSEALAEVQSDHKLFVIDLVNVTHMDSSAVGTLVAYKQKLSNNEKKLVICNLSAFLQEIFNILRMDTVFEIKSDLDAALAS
jgi:anti-anti-sigma factor